MGHAAQEPYWQPPVNHKPQFEQWVNEAITAASGSNRPVDTKYGNTDPAGTTNGALPNAHLVLGGS